MLDISPSNLLSEIEAAEKLRDVHLEHYSDVINDYVGPAGGSMSRGEYAPENHVYEYLSLMLPRLVHDNPRIRIKTRRPFTQGSEAKALEHGLNRWARDMDVRDVLMRVAYDMLICYGVTITTQQPMEGYDPRATLKPYWPNCYRISPKRFFMDPLALGVNEARYMGHKWIRDKDDLIEESKVDDTWNKDVLEYISEDTGVDEYGRDESRAKDTPTRHEIVGYEIWVPEIELQESPGPEEGFNGTIYTIGVGQSGGYGDPKKADFIREPRPYYGPRAGPYTFYGTYYVPDSPYPLSPIMATMGQMDDLNDHVRSAARSAAQYKRLILVDSKSKKLAQDIKSQPDNYVVPVESLDRDRVLPIELGGITNQQINYIEMARERLDRNSGIHDAMRGNVTGAATATEVSIAESSATVRMAYVKRQFEQAVTQMMNSVGWFLYHDDRVFFPLGQDAADEMGLVEPYYQGGNAYGSEFEDLELEIDTYSMERSNESLQQRRAMEAFQIISNVASAMPQAPYVAWDDLLKQMGDALNMPNLSTLINQEMLQQMMQEQQEQAQQAALAPGGQGGTSAQTPTQEMAAQQAAARSM